MLSRDFRMTAAFGALCLCVDGSRLRRLQLRAISPLPPICTGLSSDGCNEVLGCSSTSRTSVPSKEFVVVCNSETAHSYCYNDVTYCQPAACESYRCEADNTCLASRLPIGIACWWPCTKEGEEGYFNCETGVKLNPIDWDYDPDASSEADRTPTTSTPTVVVRTTATSPGDSNVVTTNETTTSLPPSMVAKGVEVNISYKAIPTAAACIGVIGGIAGVGLFAANGTIAATSVGIRWGGPAPQVLAIDGIPVTQSMGTKTNNAAGRSLGGANPEGASVQVEAKPTEQQTSKGIVQKEGKPVFGVQSVETQHQVNTDGAKTSQGAAGQAIQNLTEPAAPNLGDVNVLQNKVENLVETVKGAADDEDPDLNERLYALSSGDGQSREGGALSSEVLSKLFEDTISPFYH
eukprot:Blabericola_migrator_1__397@NODE_109_length_14038_cov_78_087968_g97_i0_p3_GENE_NODE_109_length_14038_cov_78_087968_g97_i0NODE_109_length_14038_cov_78_087968_g97_i0_p3_ORF_typecomplete_len406_score49_49DDA1/PF10172_9/3_NODE_109_length_14038_cov_78_087968_g97_i040645281